MTHLDVFPELLRRRRTKIVATLGPASRDGDTIARLIDAGVDVFRINMAHGDHAEHRAMIASVRAVAGQRSLPTAVLADLGGPKIRVGRLPGSAIDLRAGDDVVVEGADAASSEGIIPIGYRHLDRDVRVGDRILLDDGRLELIVQAVTASVVRARVVQGGRLIDRKGVNFPDTHLSVSAPTGKDLVDAEFAIEQGVDYLGLSFVQRAEDVRALRAHLAERDSSTRIVAKIEKPQALHHIDAIIAAADAVMVARGDLGVEMPLETVPAVQDELVLRARAAQKPVIIATQMLESMLHELRPSRAEASDVAHAVGSGSDAVMLSGETAVGEHPVEAVQVMDRIARRTEASQWARSAFGGLGTATPGGPQDVHEAMGRAVAQLSRDLSVRAILVVSRSGTSSMVVSACRPAAPLIAITADEATRRAMNLFWGVVPFRVERAVMDDPVPWFKRLVLDDLGIADHGDRGLIVRGFRDEARENLPSVTAITL